MQTCKAEDYFTDVIAPPQPRKVKESVKFQTNLKQPFIKSMSRNIFFSDCLKSRTRGANGGRTIILGQTAAAFAAGTNADARRIADANASGTGKNGAKNIGKLSHLHSQNNQIYSILTEFISLTSRWMAN